MVKKKVDSRLRTLIENGVKTGHRSMFIIVGDNARDQVLFPPLSHPLLTPYSLRAPQLTIAHLGSKFTLFGFEGISAGSSFSIVVLQKGSWFLIVCPLILNIPSLHPSRISFSPAHSLTQQTPCRNREKRIRQRKAMFKKGLADPDLNDPFDLFISSTSIRYTFYSESHKVLGNTFGMMVLQVYISLPLSYWKQTNNNKKTKQKTKKKEKK